MRASGGKGGKKHIRAIQLPEDFVEKGNTGHHALDIKLRRQTSESFNSSHRIVESKRVDRVHKHSKFAKTSPSKTHTVELQTKPPKPNMPKTRKSPYTIEKKNPLLQNPTPKKKNLPMQKEKKNLPDSSPTTSPP